MGDSGRFSLSSRYREEQVSTSETDQVALESYPGLRPKYRLVVSAIIGVVPSNTLRILLHRLVNGYAIAAGARIGFGTVLAPEHAEIGRAHIGMLNVFRGPFTLHVEDGVRIGWSNVFECVFDITEDKYDRTLFRRYCRIRRNATIIDEHFFDVTAGIEIGQNSWIAGRDSQFWTHGAETAGMVSVGHDSYVGSAVRFIPNSAVGNHSLVAVASVVTDEFRDDYVVIAGVPARVIKQNYDWATHRPPNMKQSEQI